MKSPGMWFRRLRYQSASRSFVRLMTRHRVSAASAVTSRIRAVVGPLAQRVMKLRGVFQQLSRVAFRREDSSARHQLSIRCVRRCSDLAFRYRTVVGVRSSRKGVFIWFLRQGEGNGSVDSRPVALVRETASPFGLEAADVPVDATIGSAQNRVNSDWLRRKRISS